MFALRKSVVQRFFAILTTISLALAGSPALAKPPVNGDLLDAKLLGEMSKDSLDAKFAHLGISARNGIKIYRLSYLTKTIKGRFEQASGLVIVPDAPAAAYPWISLQHGTIPTKALAPSLSPSEGLAEGSQGFVTLVTDYLGYGDSAELFHPYIIEDAYVLNGVGMLRAAKSFAQSEAINLGPLFLKGYSEGGYATLALQRALETRYAGEFSIRASSAAAGPYNPDLTGRILMQEKTVNPINVPFLIVSYDSWFSTEAKNLDLNDVFAKDPTPIVDALSGGYSAEEIFKIVPNSRDELFEADFVADFLAEESKQSGNIILHTWLNKQNLLRGPWVPQTPTRFYHCIDDKEVPAENARVAVAHYKGLDPKAPVTSILIPSPSAEEVYTHGNCPAIFAPLKWFETILTPMPPR